MNPATAVYGVCAKTAKRSPRNQQPCCTCALDAGKPCCRCGLAKEAS